MTEVESLQYLGWKDMTSNRLKLQSHWSGDSVKGYAKVRWYWVEKLDSLK